MTDYAKVTGIQHLLGTTWQVDAQVEVLDEEGIVDTYEEDVLILDTANETLNQALEREGWVISDEDRRALLARVYPARPRRQIMKNTPRQYHELLTDVLTGLEDANTPEPELFRRANYVVHITPNEQDDPTIYDATKDWLYDHLSFRLDWFEQRQDRTGQWSVQPAPPSARVAASLTTAKPWPFPSLHGIARTPLLRPDGTVLQREGYDPATGLYFHRPAGLRVTVPDRPSDADVRRALELLNELVRDFEFQSRADKVNYLALLLTPTVRQLLDVVPLALVTGSLAGSGKGLLTKCVTTIHTGGVRGISPFPEGNEEEARKTIYARLLAGELFVVWDNVRTLRSDFLKAILTAPSFSDRQLGYSRVRDMPNVVTWVATGNNIELDAEMSRRSYQVYLAPTTDRPDLRTDFEHPELLGWVAERRNDLLSAVLTLVRAWVVADRPEWTGRTMGSFEGWTRTVGGILEVAGIADDFLANMADLWTEVEDEAAPAVVWMEQVYAWRGDAWWTAAELFTANLLLPWDLAGGWSYAEQAGRTLSRHLNAVAGPFKLERGRERRGGEGGGREWRVVRVR